MDSVTQIVLGAAVGEAAIGRKVGNWAILWGAVAGTIPDLDVVSKFFVDQLTANEWHRGFSHSILFSILFAPIFGWLLSKIHRKMSDNGIADWKDWTILMFVGLITHPLLDAHTTWGTQLLWPLDIKVSYRNIFVVDPLYTVPFLVFLIGAMMSQRGSDKRRRRNNLGLIISSAYMLVTIGLKGFTFIKFQNALEAQGIAYHELQTKPTIFNSVLWSANVQTSDSYYLGYYSLFDKDDDISFIRFPNGHELVADMVDEEKLQRLIRLSEGWYTIEKFGDRLLFNDLRFGQAGLNATDGAFVFRYELWYENGELKVAQNEKSMRDAKGVISAYMGRILGK